MIAYRVISLHHHRVRCKEGTCGTSLGHSSADIVEFASNKATNAKCLIKILRNKELLPKLQFGVGVCEELGKLAYAHRAVRDEMTHQLLSANHLVLMHTFTTKNDMFATAADQERKEFLLIRLQQITKRSKSKC